MSKEREEQKSSLQTEEIMLWEQVKELEESTAREIRYLKGQLTQIDITLIHNYGKDGKTLPGIIDDNNSPFSKMIQILTHYHKIVYPERTQPDRAENETGK